MRGCKMPVEVCLAPPFLGKHEAARVRDVAIDLVADAAFLAQGRLDNAPEQRFQLLFEAGFGHKNGDNGQAHGGLENGGIRQLSMAAFR